MLWIKEPSAPYDKISGTVFMVVDAKRSNDEAAASPAQSTQSTVPLKQTPGGIILNPQPQDDPNDPLTWPIWRRDIALLTVSIYALLSGGMTPLLAPVMGTLGKQFDKQLHSLTYLVGVLMVSMGVGSAFLAPTAVLYGKRLVYLVALLLFFGGLVWGANADSYGSLMGARVLSGIGASPAESLPSTTIAEIFFAHERAYRLGIYTLLLLGGKNLSPLVSGFIASDLGWHWIFWIAAIICGAAWVAMFLFVHETWWDRTPVPDRRSRKESEAARRGRMKLNLPSWEAELESRVHPEQPVDDDVTLASPPDEGRSGESPPENARAVKRTPFFKNLSVYSGRKSNASWWMVFLRPFVLYCYPPILFSTLLYSTSVVWLSVVAETISSIFSNEPYNFPQTSIGLLYIGTFVGGVLGSAVAGKVSDVIVRIMCRRNGGIYEPEFRLVMVIPVFLAVTIGLMGFGWATFDKDLWIVPTIFLGVLGFGTSLASTVAITYVVDTYRVFASEVLVSLNLAKNVLGLAFSIFVPYFYEASGSKISYIVYGCVEIGLCLFAIPLYRYGKVVRHFMDNHDYVRMLYKA